MSVTFPKLFLVAISVLILGGGLVIHPSMAPTLSVPSANKILPNNDRLPSWQNHSAAKQRTIKFVANVTDTNNSKYYINPETRIAVFDNDGTLWSEKPSYFKTTLLLIEFQMWSLKTHN
jgi:hypothetical protein